jgi:hypothetical protein
VLANLVTDVTDTPVWFLFGATAALAVVTAGLAQSSIVTRTHTYPYWYWEFRQLAQDMKALPDPEASDRP